MAALYTQLYVAPISAAEEIALDVDERSMERYPNAWLKGIGDLELVELWTVLDPAADDGTLMEDLAWASPDGEVMVMTVPNAFVSAVNGIAEEQVAETVKAWGASELMADWSVADIEHVLREVRRVCAAAAASGHPVLQPASV